MAFEDADSALRQLVIGRPIPPFNHCTTSPDKPCVTAPSNSTRRGAFVSRHYMLAVSFSYRAKLCRSDRFSLKLRLLKANTETILVRFGNPKKRLNRPNAP
jgi:hypothetical protein